MLRLEVYFLTEAFGAALVAVFFAAARVVFFGFAFAFAAGFLGEADFVFFPLRACLTVLRVS